MVSFFYVISPKEYCSVLGWGIEMYTYVCINIYIYFVYVYIYIYVGTPAFQMGVTGHSTVNPLATTIHEFATPHVFFFAHIILRHPTIGEQ